MDYTPRTRRVLEHAERIAIEHGHDYVGTEHLLLGLLAEPDGIAGQVLAQLGVATKAVERTEQVLASEGYQPRRPRPA